MAVTSVRLYPAALKKLLESESGAVGLNLLKRVNRVKNGARARCPVDTGNLRGSIASEIRQSSTGLVGRVGSNVPYAIYVHEGTKYQAAQPFLADALGDADL